MQPVNTDHIRRQTKAYSTCTLSYISNACHSLSGVAERLQHAVLVLSQSCVQSLSAYCNKTCAAATTGSVPNMIMHKPTCHIR